MKTKKTTRKMLIKKLDKLIGDKVRARAICEKCGKGTNLQWAHIVSRSYHQTRWIEDNAFCLCMGCHFYFTHHPLEFESFVKAEIGAPRYTQLKKLALTYGKQDLAEMYERLNEN